MKRIHPGRSLQSDCLGGLLLVFLSSASANPFVINEVVTDPQSDWNQTMDGTGTPFDGVPGTGTVDQGDEYIELRNISGTTQSLEDYVLQMIDTTPESDEFGFGASNSEAYVVFDSAGGLLSGSPLTSIPAGGALIMGNPLGSMNNNIELVLRFLENTVIDCVAIGTPGTGKVCDLAESSQNTPSGNATSVQNESISRIPDGADTGIHATDFDQVPASPGRLNVGNIKFMDGFEQFAITGPQ